MLSKALKLLLTGIALSDQTLIITVTTIFLVGTIVVMSILLCNNRKQTAEQQNDLNDTSINLLEEGAMTKTKPSFSLIRRQLQGNVNDLDPRNDLKSQVESIPYNRKREIGRSAFKIEVEIGSGNFGKVHRGQLVGICEARQNTTVAIKSVRESADGTGLQDLICEIKILSRINPHPNLVSMIGSCTSELQENREIWLIIEFCEYGDFKNFLRKNKIQILTNEDGEVLNS